MGFYDAFKDVLTVAQKADNVELYRQLLDLNAQALEMQEEITRLKEENADLKRQKDIEKNIEYHVDAFITRKSDEKPIKYCAACWADKKKLVPLQYGLNCVDQYQCPSCKAKVIDTSHWNHRRNY